VLPSQDEAVDDYFEAGLHGVKFAATQRYSLYESVFETDCGPLVAAGTLVARVYRLTSPLGYPPDLVPNGLLPMAQFDIKTPLSHAVLDMDHFVEGSMPLDYSKLKDQLSSLHATIKLVLDATTTEHAKSVWE
jgi:uncharacterized protein (TIGR04255 family)